MPMQDPDEATQKQLLVERNRVDWCVDKFVDLAYDMIAKKDIDHSIVIAAMGMAKAEIIVQSVVGGIVQRDAVVPTR